MFSYYTNFFSSFWATVKLKKTEILDMKISDPRFKAYSDHFRKTLKEMEEDAKDTHEVGLRLMTYVSSPLYPQHGNSFITAEVQCFSGWVISTLPLSSSPVLPSCSPDFRQSWPSG